MPRPKGGSSPGCAGVLSRTASCCLGVPKPRSEWKRVSSGCRVIAAVGIGFVGDEIMTQAELPTQEFFQLAQNIWVAVFSASLEAAVDTVLDPSNLLSSSIQITGSWEGIVVLRCPAGLARELAGMIFGPEEIADAEIFDALGELTNLLAGALQPL